MKVDADKILFADIEDRAVFKRLLLSLERKGIKNYKITIESVEDSLSEKQEKLFRVLVSKIAEASGNDEDTIEETLLKNYGNKKSIKDFSKEDFQKFLDLTSAFSIDFFGFAINFDKNGHIQITNI